MAWLDWLKSAANWVQASVMGPTPVIKPARLEELEARLKRYLAQVLEFGMGRVWHCKFNPWAVAAGESIIKSDPQEQAEIVVAIQILRSKLSADVGWDTTNAITALQDLLLKNSLPFNSQHAILLAFSLRQNINHQQGPNPLLVSALDQCAKREPLSADVTEHLRAANNSYAAGYCPTAEGRRALHRLRALANAEPTLSIVPGEIWSDSIAQSIAEAPPDVCQAWMALFEHCQSAKASTPSGKWLKKATKHLETLGLANFHTNMSQWLSLVDETKPENDPLYNHNRQKFEPNLDLLKGLVWCSGLCDDRDLARSVRAAGASFYKKVRWLGPRSIKIGNACIYALSVMPGNEALAQLAVLKAKVKSPTGQKAIEKALVTIAERQGLPRDEIEELAAPMYGMDEIGVLREDLGDFTAELQVETNGSVVWRWQNSHGKTQKSVPTIVSEQFAEDLKELKATANDIQKMLPAQRERIDGLF
jgi:hypothetical protein